MRSFSGLKPGQKVKSSINRKLGALLGVFLILSGPSNLVLAAVPNDSSKHAIKKQPSFSSNPTTQFKIHKSYGKLPLAFEPNLGQADPQVKFLSRGDGYSLFLTPAEAVFVLKRGNFRDFKKN